MPVKSKRQFGSEGESIALTFLRQQGYEIVEQNFVYHHGEIDIIAKENDTLAFIEVKTRSNRFFGEPEEAVTPKKQELLRRTAEGYVHLRNISDTPCRFDVVSIVLVNGAPECKIIKDCF